MCVIHSKVITRLHMYKEMVCRVLITNPNAVHAFWRLTVHPMICCKLGTLDLSTGIILSNSTEYDEEAKNKATVGSVAEFPMLARHAWLVSSTAK